MSKSSLEKIVLVLGVHRSGTSALVGALTLSGLQPPIDLMPSGPDNPKGFWEPLGVVELNSAILKVMNGEWSRIGPFLNHGFTLSSSRRLIEEFANSAWLTSAKEAICASFPRHGTAILKDPRMLAFPELWYAACQAAGRDPVWIHVLRNPLEVSESIKARNSLPRNRGYQLWMTSTLNALSFDLVVPSKHTVFYDEFIDNPWETVLAVRKACGIETDTIVELTPSTVNEFVSVQDRHHYRDDESFFADNWTPQLVKDTWDLCRNWTSLETKKRRPRLKRLIDQFYDTCLLSGPIIGVDLKSMSKQVVPIEPSASNLSDKP